MADKLSIYNDALLICRERELSALTDNIQARRYLDSAWNNDLLKSILEDQDWNCFKKFVQSDYNTAITPDFGYKRAHDLPTDFGRIAGVYSDELGRFPMREHHVEEGVIYTELDVFYLDYVPDADSVLERISSWPGYFARNVAGQLAVQVAGPLNASVDRREIVFEASERRLQAESNDAQMAPSKMKPPGSWTVARGGMNYPRRRDRP